jgi:hypothetical protein
MSDQVHGVQSLAYTVIYLVVRIATYSCAIVDYGVGCPLELHRRFYLEAPADW